MKNKTKQSSKCGKPKALAKKTHFTVQLVMMHKVPTPSLNENNRHKKGKEEDHLNGINDRDPLDSSIWCVRYQMTPSHGRGQLKAIDNDVTLDDELEERGRDAEESYFDSESPAPAPSLEIPNEETMDVLGASKK
ncbi:hypothetical protein ACTXT7_010306 [Hymenolepis weldensis]